MAFTEQLDALGSWDLELAEETPDDVLAQVGYFGHLVLVDGPVDDVPGAGNGLLAAARYVGVCRARAKPGTNKRSGSGLLFWLGDEEDKGWTIESEIPLTNATLAQVVAELLPPTVTVGTVFAQADPAVRYTGKHVFQSRRAALAIALAPFGAELRVNPNFTVDVGTPAQLYDATLPLASKPSPMIVRKGAGSDVDLAAVGGQVETKGAVWDFSTKATLLGQTIGSGEQPDTAFAVGSATAPSVPWKDPQGNPVKSVRLISESGETTGSVAARAQLQLNRFNRETTAITVTADDYEISGGFGIGDATYVYDPDSGIVDAANQVLFRGEPIHPQIIRVTSLTTPILEGMTVAWRTDAGVWLDLTRWVVWEKTDSREITVGDLSQNLTKPSDPIQDRVDAARGNPSTKAPKAPTGLALSTSSAVNPKGTDSAIVTATWDPVTQYTDNTTVALSHYEVQYRWASRAPLWQGAAVTASTTVDLPVVAALAYDVQVRAWSTGGVPSAWTSTASITSAADSTGPATPSDPVVSQYLGLLRIYWDGLTSTGGAMPADFNRLDVHVGTSSGFTPSPATLVSSLSTAGYAHAQAPYGSTRYVRFIAYDHNGNPSSASATISGATVQAADGDVAALSVGKLTAGILSADVTVSGRVATALTGARREMNAVGFQAFDASNNLLINLDGVNNLLTGKLQTALTGRRMVTGSGGTVGQLQFVAPDGTTSYLRGFTATTGVEAIQLGVPIAGADARWNMVSLDNGESLFVVSKLVNIIMGGATSGANREFRISYSDTKANFDTVRRLFSVTPDSLLAYMTDAGSFQVWKRPIGGTPDEIRFDIGPASMHAYFYQSGEYSMFEVVPGPGYRARVWLEGDGPNHFYQHSQQGTFFTERRPDGSLFNRFNLIEDFVQFYFSGLNSRAQFVPRRSLAAASPLLQLLNDGSYGVSLGYFETGPGTAGRLEVTDASNTIYLPVEASAFLVSSSELGKADIRPLEAGSLDVVRGLSVTRFRRKAGRFTGDGEDGSQPSRAPRPPDADDGDDTVLPRPARTPRQPGPELEQREEIGFIAERVPAEMRTADDGTGKGPGIDVMTVLARTVSGLQELAGIVDDLKKGRAA